MTAEQPKTAKCGWCLDGLHGMCPRHGDGWQCRCLCPQPETTPVPDDATRDLLDLIGDTK